jgi:DNA-binding LacI/PurR family transcriptional regulator
VWVRIHGVSRREPLNRGAGIRILVAGRAARFLTAPAKAQPDGPDTGIQMNRRPTSLDIAAQAGVSQSTVSRVINRSALVSDDVRRRVLDAAQQLHYKIDANARQLRSRRINTIALLVLEDMEDERSNINPFFLPMIGAIAQYAADKGFDLVFSLQREDNGWGAGYCLSRPAEGIIFLGSKNFETYAENFRGYNHSNDCWVVWGLDKAPDGTVCIASDNEGGAFSAVNHLLRSGRRRIAFIGNLHSPHWEFVERFAGYRRALRAAGIEIDSDLCVDSCLTLEDGAEAAARLMASGTAFDAVFAQTDMLAVGAMRYLLSRGVRIPQQVAVMGFDDLWIGRAVAPALSTVRQDTQNAGRLLVDRVAALIDGQKIESARIPTELALRDSA